MLFTDPTVPELVKETLAAISQGRKRFVVWGMQTTGVEFLSVLNSLGFLSLVSALVDQHPEAYGREFLGLKVIAPDQIRTIDLDTVIITSDKDKESALEALAKNDERLPTLIFAGSAHYDFVDPIFEQLVKSCAVKSKAGGYPNMLVHLYQCLKYVSEKPIQGDVAEFGVYQGGTTVFMAKVLKHFGNHCQLYGFDTFKGFPERSHVLDMYGDEKCEFPDFAAVKNYCAPHQIKLIAGDIRETCKVLGNANLALSFFDTDNYSATKSALGVCVERTVPGGILAFDHYFSPAWGRTVGERIAAKQVLSNRNLFNLHGTGVFLKV